MSVFQPSPQSITFDAFIDAFGDSEQRYEMYDGDVFAMAGGSRAHSLVTVAAITALRARAKPRGCETHGPDLFVRPDDNDTTAMSPDAFVRCGPPPPKDQRYISDPVVIVEVLSPSTMEFDRGLKLRRYFNFPSVEHVILLYQDEYRAEMWTRPPEGATQTNVDGDLLWVHTVANGLTASLSIPALDDTISLSEFYDGVDLAA
jgi:Uma2 family endonuclease